MQPASGSDSEEDSGVPMGEVDSERTEVYNSTSSPNSSSSVVPFSEQSTPLLSSSSPDEVDDGFAAPSKNTAQSSPLPAVAALPRVGVDDGMTDTLLNTHTTKIAACDVRPSPNENSHFAGGRMPSARILEKFKGGMNAEELIECLGTDRDGRVHLEDMWTFMFDVSISEQSAAYYEDFMEKEDDEHVTNRASAEKEGGIIFRNGSAAAALGHFEQRLAMKFKNEGITDKKGNTLHINGMIAPIENIAEPDIAVPDQGEISDGSMIENDVSADRLDQRLIMKTEEQGSHVVLTDIITSAHTSRSSDMSDAIIQRTSDDITLTTASGRWTKRRDSAAASDVEVGAVQVDEQAPQINRRFFRGLDRPSVLARRTQMRDQARRRREGIGDVAGARDEPRQAVADDGEAQMPQGDQQSDTGEAQMSQIEQELRSPNTALRRSGRSSGRSSGILTFLNRSLNQQDVLVRATLVEDEGEVVVAERVGFFERKWKGFALCMGFFLVTMAVFVSIYTASRVGEESMMYTTVVPSMQPSMQPSFDPSPTLQLVQRRGYVRCGLRQVRIKIGKVIEIDLCRSVAAVVVGNPDKIELVPITFANRWQRLQDRAVDILISPDTHTIEREVKESSTGAGFTFSNVWMYAGMAYFGNQTLVNCAEKEMRYDECTDLVICIEDSTTHYDFIKTAFPPEYVKLGPTLNESTKMLLNGTCNVMASDQFEVLNLASRDGNFDERNFIVGRETFTKDPFGIVSRNTDREFSDIINWVLQALFYGEEHGLAKDPSLCKNSTKVTLYDVSDLDFMNALHCVGNYGEIFVREFDGELNLNNRGTNQINNGTGMLYAIPFGNLDKDDAVGPSRTMAKIRNEGSLNCGVVVPDDFEGNATESHKLIGMSVDYCRTLAAALFNGDSKDVNFSTFRESNNTSYIALANGEIDVIVGGRVQRKYDFASSPSLGGFHFSTPYYYGNEAASNDVSSYSMATREEDVLFASFVNCIVMSTLYAQENSIQSEKSKEMPLVSVFGSSLRWALRDAVAYSGSYDQIYTKHFGSEVSKVDRGRNTLNKGGPLHHSFPSLG